MHFLLAEPAMSWPALLATAAAAAVAAAAISRLLLSPLRAVPGSMLYKLTPLISQMRSLLGLLADDCEADYYTYGDIYIVGPGMVVISDPADCRRVLGSPRFIKSEIYQAFALIADNIYSTPSAAMASLRRRQLRHPLSPGYLDRAEPDILRHGARALMADWDRQLAGATGPIRVQYEAAFMSAAVDVLVALGFGAEGRDVLDTALVVQWIHDFNWLALATLTVPWTQAWPLSVFTRRLRASKDSFTAAVAAVVARRKQRVASGHGPRSADILQSLLDAQEARDGDLSDVQLIAECVAILIAGSDIVAQTLTWTLHYLLLHPAHHARAVAEVRGAYPGQPLITYASARSQLPFLDACLHESLRLRAATGVFLPRVVPGEGAVFQGHFLPGGTQVCVNVAGANHHRESWAASHEFRPDRFLGTGAASRIISFSAGPRVCPGRNLAMAEMLPLLANLLARYDFSLPPDARFRPDVTDRHGCPVAMPREHRFTCVGPRHPDRDCQVLITPA